MSRPIYVNYSRLEAVAVQSAMPLSFHATTKEEAAGADNLISFFLPLLLDTSDESASRNVHRCSIMKFFRLAISPLEFPVGPFVCQVVGYAGNIVGLAWAGKIPPTYLSIASTLLRQHSTVDANTTFNSHIYLGVHIAIHEGLQMKQAMRDVWLYSRSLIALGSSMLWIPIRKSATPKTANKLFLWFNYFPSPETSIAIQGLGDFRTQPNPHGFHLPPSTLPFNLGPSLVLDLRFTFRR
ncbi:uncharacterized protein EI90DRAFT_3134000 [Cantharellus anzutake]|uniref:uncharacterized protein n=1 Tax=Cantharellus anzutake TaxID=1750568 RepID=UPI0019058518|nr:uncharacterized protein EI90DRAFT_3134000 [Cantharellus anzutake]KAF8317252.1 hypothetical protein EI90DRAFT_3134000 [Cantharellus anzutake]